MYVSISDLGSVNRLRRRVLYIRLEILIAFGAFDAFTNLFVTLKNGFRSSIREVACLVPL